jgi:hypothetical protein
MTRLLLILVRSSVYHRSRFGRFLSFVDLMNLTALALQGESQNLCILLLRCNDDAVCQHVA